MSTKEIEVLLIEDNPHDAELVGFVLGQVRGAMEVHAGLFRTTHVERLESAIELLSADKNRFGVVLLDLQLPDARGIETLRRLREATRDLPIIVLTGLDDDTLALAAIQEGAQDWLPKDHLDGRLLSRTIRHAVERKRIEVELLQHTREVEVARARIERQAAQLQQRAEELDAINRELDDFTYIASHDLKEPLRGISAYCEILLEDYEDRLDEQGVHRLRTLTVLCDRLAEQINNLLTYCRVGRAQGAPVAVDLNEIVAEQIASFSPVLDARGFDICIDGPLPTVQADPTLVGMVFQNLISNGLKYNRSLSPWLEIGVLNDPARTLWVRDNGIGINPKYHEEIFTLFRRLHSTREYEGTGAGLTIVRKIVSSLGGRIWLDSEPGQGSTFYFTLPLAETPQDSGPRGPHWSARNAVPDLSVKTSDY
ncbi:MAG: response regulator [Pirellulales bacterium]|nr:response regulator [Pirellulales bacterium]